MQARNPEMARLAGAALGLRIVAPAVPASARQFAVSTAALLALAQCRPCLARSVASSADCRVR